MPQTHQKPKVVVIGGGTGTYTTLMGLKKYPLDLSVVLTMMDSGGSNRVIRDEFGLLPTSDIRQAMVALASDEVDDLFRKLFTYRYSQGTGLNGMTFGNLFMLALTDILGSQSEAVTQTCRLLGVQGRIIPVTLDNTQLIARYENGRQVLGEHYIDEPAEEFAQSKIVELDTIPQARANEEALSAITQAEYIIFAPGDLYTSLLSNLVVKGIKEAILKSKAKKIFVLSLMTKYGQTTHFTASDYVFELTKYLDGHNPDYILLNRELKLNRKILKRYLEEKAEPVIDDLNEHPENLVGTHIVRGDFVSKSVYEPAKGDNLIRSLVRHDSQKLAKAIVKIIRGK